MSDGGYSPEEQNKRKLAADCFKRATEAMAKQNWDYAVAMFTTCVKMVPDHLMYRQSLTGCLRKKYKDNKTGASMAYLQLSSLRSRIKKARSKKNWPEMDTAAQEAVCINPWDGQFYADLGEATRERGFLEIATFAFEQAVGPHGLPNSIPILVDLAACYERRKNFKAAIATLERAQSLDPLNGDLRTKIQGLGADMTIDKGKYEEAETAKDVKVEQPKQGYEESVKGGVQTGREVQTPGESEEADLQRMIRKEPANVAYYLKLADFYRRGGKLEEAASTFQKAFEVSGDHNIREQKQDVELDMARHNLGLAKEAASRGDDPEHCRSTVAELARELLLQEIEVFSGRVERYPNDLRMKFELGKRFMRTKSFDKAIPLLQAASKDIRIEAQVLANLGVCFLAKKQNNLAKRQFEKALEKLTSQDNPGPFKECHYYLGRLAQEAGTIDVAEKHYTEILAVDYEYKDVVSRLKDIQGGDEQSSQIEPDES